MDFLNNNDDDVYSIEFAIRLYALHFHIPGRHETECDHKRLDGFWRIHRAAH